MTAEIIHLGDIADEAAYARFVIDDVIHLVDAGDIAGAVDKIAYLRTVPASLARLRREIADAADELLLQLALCTGLAPLFETDGGAA